MKVVARRDICAGHARCAAVAPEFFELDDDGYIGFEEKEVPGDMAELAEKGVRACPERALSLER